MREFPSDMHNIFRKVKHLVQLAAGPTFPRSHCKNTVQIYLPLSFPTSGNFERCQVLMSVDEDSSLLACYAMTACDKYFEVSRSSDFRTLWAE
jgi:hypothetical protein